jgi:hypothetical protein
VHPISHDLREQITKELDRNRELSLRKDVEIKDAQVRIEIAVRCADSLL